jgi:pimeloyl-ACP methyl ester carboxylesterase
MKKSKLDAKYSMMIPDMRNSGNSQKAGVSMGYFFAEDIYSTMLFINKTFGIKKFTLYSFSLGAMGTMVLLDRQE